MEKRMIWNNDVGSEMDALEKDGFFAESEITVEVRTLVTSVVR